MNIKERHCLPTKFDVEPYGSISKVFLPYDDIQYYIQVGTESEINWQPISYLLNELFKILYEDETFINELLAQYQDCDRNIISLCDVLKSRL